MRVLLLVAGCRCWAAADLPVTDVLRGNKSATGRGCVSGERG
eukprot:gene8458-40212_t